LQYFGNASCHYQAKIISKEETDNIIIRYRYLIIILSVGNISATSIAEILQFKINVFSKIICVSF